MRLAEDKTKFLEKREDGKYKLQEDYVLLPGSIKTVALKESTKMVEYNGQKYRCIAAYTFPISRPNQENFNGRIYSSGLWENVIKNQNKAWEGQYGLCDHPDKEGSVKDSWCVWHNLRFNEDKSLILADAYLFGTWGQQMKDAIDAGGKAGMSSVGYGDFKEDGKTIDESSYELDRPADWVLNPSYGVFGTLEMEIRNEQEENITTNDKDTIVLNENINTNIKDNSKENTIMAEDVVVEKKDSTGKLNKLMENNFRINVVNQIKDVESNSKSLKEKLSAYKEIFSLFEGVDFAEETRRTLEAKIRTTEEEMADKEQELDDVKKDKEDSDKKADEKEKEAESYKKHYGSLSKKFKTSVKMLDELKQGYLKLKELYRIKEAEMNGMVTATEYKEMAVYVDKVESIIRKLEKKNKSLAKKYEALLQWAEDEGYPDEEGHAAQPDSYQTTDLPIVDDDNEDGYVKDRMIGVDNEPLEQDVNAETNVPGDDGDEEDIKESVRNDLQVRAYVRDLIEAEPRVKKIKDSLLKSKNVLEAQQTYLKLRDLIEATPSPYKHVSKKKITEGAVETRKFKPAMNRLSELKPKGWL